MSSHYDKYLSERERDNISSNNHNNDNNNNSSSIPISVLERRSSDSETVEDEESRRSSVDDGHASPAAVAGEEDVGFDEEFQRLMARIRNDETVLKEADTFSHLARLVRDFRHAAITYGKVIISEKRLRDHEKSIKPISYLNGGRSLGVAGGEKYRCGDIFFRFPLDHYNLYGGEEFSMKEANHQLKGVTALFNIGTELCLPLVAIINYHGYKLVAMSVLPIQGDDTLVYGSRDGGQQLRNVEDSQVIVDASDRLNLAKHPVIVQGREEWIHLPCDMEVHKVRRGGLRYYAADFARLFPPQPTPRSFADILSRCETGWSCPEPNSTEEQRGAHLVYLLRPELVRSFHKPLSSDAFSRFESPRDHRFREDVKEAAYFLFRTVIPQVANVLSAKPYEEYTKPSVKKSNSEEDVVEKVTEPEAAKVLEKNAKTLRFELRQAGVNMRFLGILFPLISTDTWKQEVLLESVARVCKALIRGKMREAHRRVRTAAVSSHVKNVAAELNKTLGAVECTANRVLENGEFVPDCANCALVAEKKSCPCLCAPQCNNRFAPLSESFLPSASLSSHEDDTSFPSIKSFWTGSGMDKTWDEMVEEIKKKNLVEEEMRRLFWCHHVPGFLRERFWFAFSTREEMRHKLITLSQGQFPPPTCLCCVCLWKRLVPPAILFSRLQRMCNIQLSPSSQAACDESVQASFRNRLTTKTLFHRTSTPFQENDIDDLEEYIKVLPIMEFAQGTHALVSWKMWSKAGHLEDAKHFLKVAIERFNTGLELCPSDPRLLCNLGMALEDIAYLPRETSGDHQSRISNAMLQYLRSVQVNPRHARSWYLLGRLLSGRYNKIKGGRMGSRRKLERYESMCKELSLDGRLNLLAWILATKRNLGELGVHETDRFGSTVSQRGEQEEGSRVEEVQHEKLLLMCMEGCFQVACKLSEENVDWIKELANYYKYTTGQIDKAEELYKEVLSKDSEHLLTLSNFSCLLLDRADVVQKALRQRRRLKLEPDGGGHDPVDHVSLEMVTKAREDFAQAIELLHRLKDCAPSKVYERWNLCFVMLEKMCFEQEVLTCFGDEEAAVLGLSADSVVDLESVEASVCHLEAGMEVMKQFEERNREYGARAVRLFDEGDHSRQCVKAIRVLTKIGERLSFVYYIVFRLLPDLGPTAGSGFQERLENMVNLCFDTIRYICNAELQYGARAKQADHLNMSRLRKGLLFSYLDHIKCLLRMIDESFKYPSYHSRKNEGKASAERRYNGLEKLRNQYKAVQNRTTRAWPPRDMEKIKQVETLFCSFRNTLNDLQAAQDVQDESCNTFRDLGEYAYLHYALHFLFSTSPSSPTRCE